MSLPPAGARAGSGLPHSDSPLPGARHNTKFTRDERIKTRTEFQKVYRIGSKIWGKLFVLYYLDNKLPCSRLGLTVSQRIGNSVVRNLVKRRCREIFRTNKATIPGHLDIVLNAQKSLADCTFQEMESEFRWMMRKATSAIRPRQ